MSFFHQTITSTDSEEEAEGERISFESEVLACYKERLSSKEEEEDSAEEEEHKEKHEEEQEEDSRKKPEKKVSFSEDVLVCPTYTREEYDRYSRGKTEKKPQSTWLA